ncbi:hypothetical protein FISHEDRAFT_77481 [Fistulina hepatica ATCC 64428]|uniref:Uncharacterized protein n=1 Tax=Fistulina hepatica ATCC 64428 TaxID=1128425 RepID=A0A0D7A1G3_9AGAR|nr:hypothetical protein FISHEDRAFT_77481 [Fistulina hepatica ATCC 64428]
MLQMPRLRNLTLLARHTYGAHPIPQADTIRLFLAKHGRRLNHLQLRMDDAFTLSNLDLEICCPSLQHLVIELPTAISFSHPNIRWIDAWWYSRRHRALHRPPLWENDAALFSITFPGIIDIVHKRGRVYRRDLAYLDDGEGECWDSDEGWDYPPVESYSDSWESGHSGLIADTSENSSDGDYTPSERLSRQYETDFDSDLSLHHIESGEDEDSEEINHDMALAIHSALSVRERRQSTSRFATNDFSSDINSSSTSDREDDTTESHNQP